MHRTRSKGKPEYQIQPKLGRYIRQTTNDFLKQQKEMADPDLNPRLFGDCYKQTYEGNQDFREINVATQTKPDPKPAASCSDPGRNSTRTRHPPRPKAGDNGHSLNQDMYPHLINVECR